MDPEKPVVPGTVAASDGRGDSAPTGPAALPPGGPEPPAAVHTLRTGSVGHAHPLVAPLEHSHRRMTGGKISTAAGNVWKGAKMEGEG